MFRYCIIVVVLLLAGCHVMPEGGGPNPNAVLVVSAHDYPIARVLGPLNALKPELGTRINMKQKDDNYGSAYWYQHNGSMVWGVGFYDFSNNIKPADAATKVWLKNVQGRYFIEVYDKGKTCTLCSQVEHALKQHHVSFFSACTHPEKSTPYEKRRCGGT